MLNGHTSDIFTIVRLQSGSSAVRTETSCPICLQTRLSLCLERDEVPVFQNALFKYRNDAKNIDRGTLQIVVCHNCGFIFNSAFRPDKAPYGRHYDNNQTCSREFSQYLELRVQELVERRSIRDCTIVEVGCGNGWFINHLVSASPGTIGYGFDPAYRGNEQALNGRVLFFDRNYGAGDAALNADIVICRHVIEHVVDPLDLLAAVRLTVEHSNNAIVFFETPDVEWVLLNYVIWDFFYEHCSYFSSGSLRWAFERAGFEVDRVERVFGDQYLWLEAMPAKGSLATSRAAGPIPAFAENFRAREPALRRAWQQQVLRLQQNGKVGVWGAGAKGVTFLNLIDPSAELIDCAVDLNPAKQGQFIGGTGHPIIAPDELKDRGVSSALLMNPNYRDENSRLVASLKADISLIG